MRVLLDHCAPSKLRGVLAPREVVTALERGWEELRDGPLLRAAAAEFDAVVTLDGSMPFQNNVRDLDLAVLVIKTFDPTGMNLWLHAEEIGVAVENAPKGEFTILRLH